MSSSPENRNTGAAALRFSVVGVVNTLVGFGAIAGASLLGASPLAANVLGYAVGLVVSYTLNSRYTFKRREAGVATVLRYLAAFGGAFGLNIVVVLCASSLDIPRVAASVAGVPVYMVVFFLTCRYWVFTRP